jgi:uncharacterized pyridoxamine 5'-phosphate oxidase family protein
MSKHLQFLRDLKSVSYATVDGDKPCIRIADVMLYENNSLYFLTGRGKAFYYQLMKNPHLALIGMDRKYKTVRVSGKAELVGREFVDKIFEANPMMNDLYAGEKRDILDAFCIKDGEGEMFDLGCHPIHRERFTFGNVQTKYVSYHISDECIECGACEKECISGNISKGSPYTINQESCLECGRCVSYCPVNAIKKPKII